MKCMRDLPHKTVLGVARDALHAYRMRRGLTNGGLAIDLVDFYRQGGWRGVWPIEFQESRDAGRDAATNSERIWRWLDDQTKETNLLPVNLLPVLLAYLPMDLRLRCVSEMLLPLGLSVSIAHTTETQATHAALMAGMAKEAGEGVAAFAELAEALTPEQLMRAKVEIEEGIESKRRALDFVTKRLAGGA